MPSREFELVVSCCAWPRGGAERERIAACAAAGPGLDWGLVSRIAYRQRVSGLVHQALRQVLPELKDAGLEPLARDAAAAMREGLLLAAESARLLKALRAGGVEPLFLKGSALAVLAYGSVGLRPARDIDLLVRPEEAETADALLLAEGYVVDGNQGLRGETMAERVKLQPELAYVHPARRVMVELHWQMFALEGLSEGVREAGRQSVAVAPGVELPTLPAEELLLYLCVHGSTHAWGRLKWIADVYALLAQRPEGFAAASAQLLQQARARGMGPPVEQALLVIYRLFGGPRPRVGWRARLLAATALRAMTAGDAVTEPTEMQRENTLTSLSFLLLRPRLGYVAEVARFLVYSPYLMEQMPAGMPKAAYPLWRGYRWVKNRVGGGARRAH